MKKMIVCLVIAMLVSVTAFAYADGQSINGYYCRIPGIVISTNVAVRVSPSTSADSYGQLHNGDSCMILGRMGDWYVIDLASCGLKDDLEGFGYAKASLIEESPRWIILTEYTVLYSDPWGTGDSNGEKSAGTPLLVTHENWEYYCVQTRGESAGASFVRKSDVGNYSSSYYAKYIVVDGDAPVYDCNNTDVILGKLKTQDIVEVISYGLEYSQIIYTSKDGYTYNGLVRTQNLNPIIN